MTVKMRQNEICKFQLLGLVLNHECIDSVNQSFVLLRLKTSFLIEAHVTSPIYRTRSL